MSPYGCRGAQKSRPQPQNSAQGALGPGHTGRSLGRSLNEYPDTLSNNTISKNFRFLHLKYGRYLYKTNITVLTILSAIKLIKVFLSTTTTVNKKLSCAHYWLMYHTATTWYYCIQYIQRTIVWVYFRLASTRSNKVCIFKYRISSRTSRTCIYISCTHEFDPVSRNCSPLTYSIFLSLI